ncbi:SRPBCC domain-containing protein [Deinococcus hohokamensis]|uniref:SRPBCC domain-containing protein n=1 Tax=Deinococcus hohokamensis TaxID=309883 RepID=A0ABV9I4E4_9DEIO
MTQLTSEPRSIPHLDVTRTVDAPRERVWHMFTQPEHLACW